MAASAVLDADGCRPRHCYLAGGERIQTARTSLCGFAQSASSDLLLDRDHRICCGLRRLRWPSPVVHQATCGRYCQGFASVWPRRGHPCDESSDCDGTRITCGRSTVLRSHDESRSKPHFLHRMFWLSEQVNSCRSHLPIAVTRCPTPLSNGGFPACGFQASLISNARRRSPNTMPLQLPICVESKRLVVRMVEEADLGDLLLINQDDEVTRYLPYESWRSLEDASDMSRSALAHHCHRHVAKHS